jgi:pimeloyl-ACP methyl ester carboxylesterase
MRAVGRPVLMALAVFTTMLAASAPQADGRGSSAIVGVTDIGSGARETWVLLPSEDPATCIVVFLHGAGEHTPSRYLGWLDHLALDESCAVVFPRYQLAGNTVPTTLGDLRAGVSAGITHVRRARYGFERRRSATTLRTVVAGVGLGGSLAFYYAANAKRWGLPVPAAIDSIFPTAGRLPGLPLERAPRGAHVLVQIGDENRAAAAELRAYLASHPGSHKRFQAVHGKHDAPLEITDSSLNTFWSPLDALIDAAP